MIKSYSQAILIQCLFRYVHGLSRIEIVSEFSFVGIQDAVNE
jgi:hypothetical protein